jgi:hypothetical protein
MSLVWIRIPRVGSCRIRILPFKLGNLYNNQGLSVMNGTGARLSGILKIFERYMHLMIVIKEELEHLKKSLQKL